MLQPYWMVHRVSGQGQPTVKHATKKLAIKEAKRLAFNCPGEQFAVLETVDCYATPPATIRVEIASCSQDPLDEF